MKKPVISITFSHIKKIKR